MEEYLIQPFLDFTKHFEKCRIPYVLMGGLAVSAHGIPRPTHDLDFTILLDRNRLPELFHAAESLGYSVSDEYKRGWVDEVAGMPLVRVRQWVEGKAIDVDIFLTESKFQRSVIDRRIRLEVDGFPTSIVTPEDLILLKLIAGRPRDIGDIHDVFLAQGQLDEAYMRHWAAELGVLPLLNQILDEWKRDL